MVFRFGDHVLDTERRELRRGVELIALEPQVFDLLAYLVRNRGRVVSKDDLIDGVWGGRIVSDSALTTRLNAARKAVNDSGAAQRVIRTFARKGVRFVAEVTENGTLEAAAVAPEPSLALPDKPSIAVLPFANLSGDPEQQYFADGMAEEIITALSRIRWLFVIARNSRLTGRRFRTAGQRGCKCRRSDRAGAAGRRSRSLGCPADDRPRRLRLLPPCACGLLSHDEGGGSRGSGTARAGDRYRSALWAGDCPRGVLPYAIRQLLLGRRSCDGRRQGRRPRTTGIASRLRRPRRNCQCSNGPRRFRRGHRYNDGVGRPCAGAQSELRSRLVP